MERTQWYKNRVFYQIWPRSFKDGNGDGVGDLWGVYEKLDYIKSLGIGGICFAPLFPSPGVRCGYDIAHYTDIAPEYGSIQAFRQVLFGAHERDLKVILELVVNCTSDQHEWFQKSRQRMEPYTDYYIWRPGRADGSLPNNWDSNFGGKAWTWDEVRQEYYLHLFASQQPELNMDNPLVRNELKRIFRFWLDLGVDGFQLDGLTYISKKQDLPDDYLSTQYKGLPHYNHGPNIHKYLKEFNRDVFQYYDCITMTDPPFITPKQALTYIQEGPQQEIDLILPFQAAGTDWLTGDSVPFRPSRMKHSFSNWQQKLLGKAWNVLYLENHNRPRAISYCGDPRYWRECGKMLAACYLFQLGTPFVYQGQEIGMTNWYPEDAATEARISLGSYFQQEQTAEPSMPTQEDDSGAECETPLPVLPEEDSEDILTDAFDVDLEDLSVEETYENCDDGLDAEIIELCEDAPSSDDIAEEEELPPAEISDDEADTIADERIDDIPDTSTEDWIDDEDSDPEASEDDTSEDMPLFSDDLDEDLRWCEELVMDEDLQWYETHQLFEDSQLFEDIQTLLEEQDGDEEKEIQNPELWHGAFDFVHSPMQWNEEIHAGFTTETPWFYVNKNYTEINAAEQEDDPDSILNFYKKAIHLRQTLSCVRYGDYREFCKSSSKVYMYARQDGRQRMLVVCSFSDKPIAFRAPRDFHIDTGKLVLQNYSHIKTKILQPYEARVYLWK